MYQFDSTPRKKTKEVTPALQSLREAARQEKTSGQPRMQDSATSQKHAQARQAYAQRQASAAQTSTPLDTLTKQWDTERKRTMLQTAPPALAEQIKAAEQPDSGHVWKTRQASAGQAFQTPSAPAQRYGTIPQCVQDINAPKPKAPPTCRTRGLSPSGQSVPAPAQDPLERRTRSIGGLQNQQAGRHIDSPLMLENIGGFLKDNTTSGLSQFNGGLARTADFFLPDALTPKPIQKAIDYYKDTEERTARTAAQNNEQRFGRAGPAVGNLYQGTVSALPRAIAAFMTGGASASRAAIDTLRRAGISSGMLQMVEDAMKNPGFWASFAQTVGCDYENAKANGANEMQAQASAITGSLLNAGVEVSGGVEQMARSGSYGLRDWVKSAVGEGLEEVEQGITSGIVDKGLFDYDKSWFSATDENAVVNPRRAAQEFAGGAVAGGILSGAGAAANHLRGYMGRGGQAQIRSTGDFTQADTYEPPVGSLDETIILAFPEARTDPDLRAALRRIAMSRASLASSQGEGAHPSCFSENRSQWTAHQPESGYRDAQGYPSLDEKYSARELRIDPHEKITFDYINRMEPGIPQQIGTVDISDENAVISQLAVGEQKIIDLPFECNYTITARGEVMLIRGNGSTVDPSNISGDLRGSYSYHNHPDKYTRYSFSAEDAAFFIESGQAYSGASDHRYEYFMKRTPATVEMSRDEVYHRFKEIEQTDVLEMKWNGKIDPDLDGFHEVMKILSEEMNFYYGRQSK